MVSITIDNELIPIHVDSHGNLYLEHKQKLFQLNIDKNDDPTFGDYGECNYNVIPNDTLKNTQKITKGQIIKSEKFVDDIYLVEDNGHELVHEKNPDSDDVNFSATVDDDYYYGYENDIEEPPFIFYESECNLDIYDRENGDVNALYDILIYDDSDKDEHAKLIFQTKIPNEICMYRVAIYKSGKIFFRPIGCYMEKRYKLSIVDDLVKISHK